LSVTLVFPHTTLIYSNISASLLCRNTVFLQFPKIVAAGFFAQNAKDSRGVL
jgi:hypothetical protein